MDQGSRIFEDLHFLYKHWVMENKNHRLKLYTPLIFVYTPLTLLGWLHMSSKSISPIILQNFAYAPCVVHLF